MVYTEQVELSRELAAMSGKPDESNAFDRQIDRLVLQQQNEVLWCNRQLAEGLSDAEECQVRQLRKESIAKITG